MESVGPSTTSSCRAPFLQPGRPDILAHDLAKSIGSDNNMKIRGGIPPFFQFEEDVPSLPELIDMLGPVRELPHNKIRRLHQSFKSYSHRKRQLELSGRLDIHLD